MICRATTDLNMEMVGQMVERFQHQLGYVLRSKLHSFEPDPMHPRKTKKRYEKEVEDITFGFYYGLLLRCQAAEDTLGVFAVLSVSEGVGLSPVMH